MNSSDAIYSSRLENLILLDGKDMDLSDVSFEFDKDCKKLICIYIALLLLSVVVMVCMIKFWNILFTNTRLDDINTRLNIRGALFMIMLIALFLFSLCEIVALWKARYKSGFKGIRGTCDNVVRISSRNGEYHAYHCTTELGEHGIAFVRGRKQRVSIGDAIVYIRVFGDDLIYKDQRR
ncbi:hypothetical protein D6853_06530 [Butyrivibrio sp. X503]|uniref:hypothetical protein n=1 Tax=Butyrivibrio sp. X503 TaxID=2364878 RepID=UPI000EAAA0A7|nr:hypothetical protein [Butyrivibrio sp. X503]RKM56438.1 hypothetical protein D6853_06530 [Butyrivibrio sp. X503]